MKYLLLALIFALILPCTLEAQQRMKYDKSPENPFGLLNPNAPKEVADYAPMIGICDCISTARKPDQSWGEGQKMTWKWSYIMNGYGVQDETLKEDGSHSGSIRQFIADSSKWFVHWYSNNTPSTSLPSWSGGKRGDSIVLYRAQKAPNAMDGFYRLTFKDISEKGYNWIGEWVDSDEKIVYPTWKIACTKRTPKTAKEIIHKNTKAFSAAYMKGDSQAIADFYTEDAKLFPGNSDIVIGRAAIKGRWDFVEQLKEPYHKVTPSEVKIIGDYAYDYGYYEGSSVGDDGKKNTFKGKYVIVWKKIEDDWKIYLDIWNRI